MELKTPEEDDWDQQRRAQQGMVHCY